MAFRKKASLILSYQPDILIIQECECEEKLFFLEDLPKASGVKWFGENNNKGMGVFAYNNYHLQTLEIYNKAFKMIVPIAVTSPGFNFNLFAVWANNPAEPRSQYIGQVWKAINFYNDILGNTKTIIAGDFNSNKIWDKQHKEISHSGVVDFLAGKEIFSTYHLQHTQLQGSEQHPTLFLYRHKDKPFHIDYCFASADMLPLLQSVEVGDFETWATLSDHVPLIISFDI